MPPYALIVAAAVPAVIIIGSKFSTDALTKIVSFAALGICIAFQMVVLLGAACPLQGVDSPAGSTALAPGPGRSTWWPWVTASSP